MPQTVPSMCVHCHQSSYAFGDAGGIDECVKCRSDSMSRYLTPHLPPSERRLIFGYVESRLVIDTECKFCGNHYSRIASEMESGCISCRNEFISDPLVMHLPPNLASMVIHDYLDSPELSVRDPPVNSGFLSGRFRWILMTIILTMFIILICALL